MLDSPAPGGPSSQAASPSLSAPGPTQKPAPKLGETYIDIPHSNMRKTIAKRLTQSKVRYMYVRPLEYFMC